MEIIGKEVIILNNKFDYDNELMTNYHTFNIEQICSIKGIIDNDWLLIEGRYYLNDIDLDTIEQRVKISDLALLS